MSLDRQRRHEQQRNDVQRSDATRSTDATRSNDEQRSDDEQHRQAERGRTREDEAPETQRRPVPGVKHEPEPDAGNIMPAENEPGTL